MAEPRIKTALESPEFTTDLPKAVRDRLTACLMIDPQHILPKARGGQNGPHVEAIQKALKKINDALPIELKIGVITDPAGEYGGSTAGVVLKFKELNAIQRTGQAMDNVVGRMTITQLDDELMNLRRRPAPGPTPPTPPPAPPVPPPPSVLPVGICRQNPLIIFDGTTGPQRNPPISPGQYVARMQQEFDVICANRLGNALVQAVKEQVFIKPFLSTAVNAFSDGQVFFIAGAWELRFTPDNFDPVQSQPGCRADEVVLHELLHMIEHNFGGYSDAADNSLRYDGADFVTINGSNVYSNSSSRGLRHDHRGFLPMAGRYATDPREHAILFRENYVKAFDNNQTLFNIFKNASATWNPFSGFQRNLSSQQFRVRVSAAKEFEWIYDLFSDNTARWRDVNNVAEFGIGTWRKSSTVEPPDLSIRDVINVDWKGGGFDRFPLRGQGVTVEGRNKTGGVERDSKVTQQ